MMNVSTLTMLWTTAAVFLVSSVRGTKKVHFKELGDFSLEPPWVGLKRPLPAPQSPEKLKLDFYLMTKKTVQEWKNADVSVDAWKILTTDFYKPVIKSLQDLDFKSNRKRTAVHVNGMYISEEWNWNIQKRLAVAYLRKVDANIIFVKYNAKIFRRQNFYTRLVANIRVVGAIAARFLEQLMEMTKLRADQIHIIGFSLGAHAAAYIGKRLKNLYRITGLDPAKPFFENADPMYRLDKTDARHVDVLHTHTVRFLPLGGLGVKNPIGHVDFYFNNGFIQPGCVKNHIGDVMKNNLTLHFREGLDSGYVIFSCSHMRVIDYWTESLENSRCVMWGVDTKPKKRERGSGRRYKRAPVGLHTFDRAASGKYFVLTRSRARFCIKRYRMTRMIRGQKSFRRTMRAALAHRRGTFDLELAEQRDQIMKKMKNSKDFMKHVLVNKLEEYFAKVSV